MRRCADFTVALSKTTFVLCSGDQSQIKDRGNVTEEVTEIQKERDGVTVAGKLVCAKSES